MGISGTFLGETRHPRYDILTPSLLPRHRGKNNGMGYSGEAPLYPRMKDTASTSTHGGLGFSLVRRQEGQKERKGVAGENEGVGCCPLPSEYRRPPPEGPGVDDMSSIGPSESRRQSLGGAAGIWECSPQCWVQGDGCDCQLQASTCREHCQQLNNRAFCHLPLWRLDPVPLQVLASSLRSS